MENLNALKILEDFFGNSARYEFFQKYLEALHALKKSAGNIGGNNPNPALNMFVKIKTVLYTATIPLNQNKNVAMHIF